MDPNQKFFPNSQNISASQPYYPSLDHIQNSEEFMQFETAMNSQFSPNVTQPPIPQNPPQKAQQTSTNTSTGPQGWTDQEDKALMSCWCHVSENKIVGTNQKSDALWQRVLDMYQEARVTNPLLGQERSAESLRSRFKRFNTNVTKWIGAYKEAYGRKRSGMSEEDVEREAQTIYGKKKFMHKEVFEQVMCRHPKWELRLEGGRKCKLPDTEDSVEEGHGSSKKSRTDEDGSDPTESTPETPVSRASSISRPSGRDKAKAKRQGKATASQSPIFPEEFTAELHALRIQCEREIDVLSMKNEVMLMKVDMDLFAMLMNTSHLSPQDEELKLRSMTKLFPN